MTKILFSFLLIIYINQYIWSQDFNFDLTYPVDSVMFGYGIEAGIRLKQLTAIDKSVTFKLKDIDGVQWKFQPDTLYKEGYTVLSIKVNDSSRLDKTVQLDIMGMDDSDTVQKTMNLKVFDAHLHINYYIEKKLIVQAIAFIKDKYPEFEMSLNEIDTTNMICYKPFPEILIVDHSIFLQEQWRINTLEHVMIPPDDWKLVYIYNKKKDLYFGVKFNTDNECSEIPCQIYYYCNNINYNPLNIYLMDSTIDENNAINDFIGNLQTEDNFDTLTYSYSIVNANTDFIIANQNELRANAIFDYENKALYKVKIKSANEMGYALIMPFNIHINDIDEPNGIDPNEIEFGTYRIINHNIVFTIPLTRIELYDVMGNLLKTTMYSEKINISDITDRIVIVRFYKDHLVQTKKLKLY